MLLPIVHFLHIAIAAFWAGATLFCGLVLFPLIARLPPDQAAELFARVERPIAAGLGSAAGVTYLLGVARALVGGGIAGWGDLVSAYGLLVLSAVAVMMGIEHLGGRLRRRIPDLLRDAEVFAAKAPPLARRTGLLQAVLIAGLIGIMVVLGLALY